MPCCNWFLGMHNLFLISEHLLRSFELSGCCCPLPGSDGLPDWHPGEGLQKAGVPHQQDHCDEQEWEDSNQGHQRNRRSV